MAISMKRILFSLAMVTLIVVIVIYYSQSVKNDLMSDNKNIYSDAGRNMLSPTVKNALKRVYVPNSRDNTVSIIDPTTYTVIGTFVSGKNPQHIVPSYDLKTL